MKRRGHIVDRITLADIRREAAAISSSKRFRRRRAELFLDNFDTEAPKILDVIRTGNWHPRPLRIRDIFEHGKMRHIAIPDFEDMLVQRVLFYPRLEKLFVDHTWHHSYSSIKNRGPLRAAKHVARLIRSRSARWALYFDARKYYENIDREIVKQDVRRIVKDPAALRLLDTMIGMGDCGISIGNTASHFLANLYMTPIVRQIAAMPGVKDVVVYMDNVYIFAGAKKTLHAVRKDSARLLAARGLTMKGDWQIFRTDMRAVKIGGFRVQRGRPWRIYRKTFTHLKRVIRDWNNRPTVHAARSLASLKGWITSAGCRSFYNRHINPIWPSARKALQT